MNKRNFTMIICLGIGTAIGVATHQLAVWVAIGAALSIALNRTCCRAKSQER